ncbi:MAG: acyl-CoA dehydratase activase [Peptococcaceae bacterium]|nr:acyl-CoA dehydratase activase [Peptococcaceae bacterium]
MITAGVDAGSKFAKAVIMKDGQVLSMIMAGSGFDRKAAAGEAFAAAVAGAGISEDEVEFVLATGAGKGEVTFAHGTVTEVIAGARGAVFLVPSGRTVIDTGAEGGRVLKCDGKGKVIDFAVNEKCAAGAGSFIEAIARVLDVSLEEMGSLALKSGVKIPMNAQCAVFAESEVVSLIHSRVSREDISKAVHDALAGRIISMVRRVGLEKELVITGGVGRNPGFVKALEDGLEIEVLVPENPEFAGAVGAALAAAEKASGRRTIRI